MARASWFPPPQLDKARLATAAKGGVKSGRLGFEIFDKPNWVGSEFDEQVNYQRALEGELEHTVGTLSDDSSRRACIWCCRTTRCFAQERPAKASVVLKLRHRSLADGEPEAIRNLVASAVDGLTPDHVVLVDAAGNLPLGPKTADAMRLSAEQALEDKLVATLEPVTGRGQRARLGDARLRSRGRRGDPGDLRSRKDGDASMQRTEQTTGAQPVAAGVPGTASNAPNTQADCRSIRSRRLAPQSAKTESGTYGASKTVRHVVENPGRVRRLTAAIVVNDRLMQPASKNHAARLAAALGRRAAQPDGAGPGGGGIRHGARRCADGRGSGLRRATARSRRSPLRSQILNTAENSPVLVKYAALLVGIAGGRGLCRAPAIRHAGTALATREPGKPASRELAAAAAAQATGAA
jgi:flagellar M-ring protein FliF